MNESHANDTVTVAIIRDFDSLALADEWRGLEQLSDCSFFQSWHWMGAWLKSVCSIEDTCLLRFSAGERLVGLCLVENYTYRRRRFFPVTVAHVNESAEDLRDMCIEYNRPLAVRGFDQAVLLTLLAIPPQALNADEIHLRRSPCYSPGQLQLLEQADHELEVETSWRIDLAVAGDTVDQFINNLKKKRRWQIRQSLKEYEVLGGLQLSVAETRAQAEIYLNGLERFHTRRWEQAGYGGSFANPQWKRFINSIVSDGFDQGIIQLVEIRAGAAPIAYLLNFVWRGTVYVLQTGFELEGGPHHQPGYISHIYAAVANKALGHRYYDFMTGDSLYKRILSNDQRQLYSLCVQQPGRLKLVVESQVVRLIRLVRGIKSRITAQESPT